jgi:hypothetical protein
MKTNRTSRIAGFMAAVLVAFAVNGAMLWKFDSVAHQADLASNAQGQTIVNLEPVVVVSPRS